MINSVNPNVQTLLQSGIVLFTNDRVRSRRSNASCGGWLYHDSTSGQFTLVNRGCCDATFEIQFNANITSATTGSLALAIQTNGEPIEGTEMDYTVATANVYGNVSSSTLVTVPAGASVVISVENITTALTLVKDPNIIIKKI